jgi:anaerobic selenocysteine-containing dehydrogenase
LDLSIRELVAVALVRSELLQMQQDMATAATVSTLIHLGLAQHQQAIQVTTLAVVAVVLQLMEQLQQMPELVD